MTVLDQYDPDRFLQNGVYTPDQVISPEESSLSKSMTQTFLTAVIAAKVLDWSGLGQRWARTGFDADDFHKTISEKFIEVFKVGMVGILAEAVLHGTERSQQEFGHTISVPDHVVQAWATTYAQQVATQVADTNTKAIQDIVNQGLNGRVPASALADRAMQIYGLDQRAANTYTAYASNKILPKNTTLMDVATRYLVERAVTIGAVQTFSAINHGHQLVYMQAMHDGLLDTDARKVWVTALDERVCPTCGPMDGIAVPVNEEFEIVLPLPKTGRGKNRQSVKVLVPPVHPNCRCVIVLEDQFVSGLITRTARRKNDEKFRAMLFSEPEDLVIQKGFWQEALHPRNHGKFAAVGGVAAAGAMAFHNIGSDRAKPVALPRHLQRVDRKVKSSRSGFYAVPRQYLDFHQRGLSFRVGQEDHINEMARSMKRTGYNYGPVTLHVYDDAVDVADGNHRIEAAYRARVGTVPTRIVRIKGNKPVTRGVVPALRERRTEAVRSKVATRYLLDENRTKRLSGLNSKLMSQDEKKHQWHSSRPRSIKPL